MGASEQLTMDLLSRLRACANNHARMGLYGAREWIEWEAADEIERLHKEVREVAEERNALAEELQCLKDAYHANGWPGPDGTTLEGENKLLRQEILDARRAGRMPDAFWLRRVTDSAAASPEEK